MASEITEQDSMFYAGKMPWHKLGNPVDTNIPKKEAIIKSGLGWTVELRKMGFIGKDGTYKSTGKDCLAIVRTDTDTALGYATESYKPIQNFEAFDFLDNLIEKDQLLYHTAGSLRGGRNVWILAQMKEEYFVGPDKFLPYLLFVNSHNGKESLKVLPTPVRVVCANTMRLAISSHQKEYVNRGIRMWVTRHSDSWNSEYNKKKAKEVLGLMSSAFKETEKKLNKLREVKMTFQQFQYLVTQVYGEQTKTSRVHPILHDLYNKSIGIEDQPELKDTRWSAYCAITEFHSHRYSGDTSYSKNTDNEKSAIYSWMGTGSSTIEKAQDLLLSDIAV